jgi:hypothetical protein
MGFDYFNSHVYLVEYAGGTTFVNTSPKIKPYCEALETFFVDFIPKPK